MKGSLEAFPGWKNNSASKGSVSSGEEYDLLCGSALSRWLIKVILTHRPLAMFA